MCLKLGYTQIIAIYKEWGTEFFKQKHWYLYKMG